MLFEKILILGKGRVSVKCSQIAKNFFNQEINFVDLEENKLDNFFENIKNSLIISANNFYIFKEKCIKNNTIINYHNSLLPKHKGVNAHIWAIWEKDSKSGITWHKIDENIDTGDILVQKEIILDDDTTALKLLSKQHNLAINSFQECLENLQANKFYKQDLGGGYHYKKDLPNDGILEFCWEKEKISRFLRAMENNTSIKIKNNGIIQNILSFQINKHISIELEDKKIIKI